jgi:hypothetical protein
MTVLKTKDLCADQGIHFAKIGSFATETNLAWISTDNHLPKRDGDRWPSHTGLGFGIEHSDHDPARDR